MRLGRIEKWILEYLTGKGKAEYSMDLVWALHNADKDGDESWDRPPRGLDSSVRCAIHRLQKKGLLLCGEAPQTRYNNHKRLICWLPEHEAPMLIGSVPGREVEQAIIKIMRETKDDEIENWLNNSPYRAPKILGIYEREVGDIPYIWLVRRVAGCLGAINSRGLIDGWCSTAINRAVNRLISQNIIEVVYKHDFRKGLGDSHPRRIMFVRLTDNVAM